jgi:LmbE family N-acetylglucosaminyl deacetylase
VGAVYESTINRDAVRAMMAELAAGAPPEAADDFDPDAPADDGNPFGMPEADLTHAVDVSAYVSQKRLAIACHASQVTDTGFFLTMPPEAFAAAFGTEWFIRRGARPGLRPGWLFEG